jgi:methanogenic corrinoid protein MtbC1
LEASPLSLEASSPQALERKYLALLLAPDGRQAQTLVQDALAAGVPAATLYLDVIARAMYEVGRLWETAQVSVAQEHLATQITQTVIAALGLHLTGGDPVGAGRTAVVSSSPGETHALGGQMVSDFLEAQGWSVSHLGAGTPEPALADLAGARGADVVALSTSLPGHLLSVTRTCELLRRLPAAPYIVVGGRA